MAYTEDPEEVLRDVWGRVERTPAPVDAPPGREWHFALGALFAFGSVGALTDQQIREWETRAQREARRLGADSSEPSGESS